MTGFFEDQYSFRIATASMWRFASRRLVTRYNLRSLFRQNDQARTLQAGE